MLRRLTHLSLALWWLVWTLVIVPAHTRGIISLDGSYLAGGDKSPLLFGALVPPCCAHREPVTPSKAPAPKSADNCAICQLAATTPHTPPSLGVPLFLQ